MQIRHQIFFTLMNFVVITWIIIWVKIDRPVEGKGAQGRRELKEKVDFEVMQVLRKLQAPQVNALLNLDVDSMSNKEAVDRFYREVSTPVQGVCHSLKRFGGRWWPHDQAFDGDKFVCTDSYSSKDCLVYSFGTRSEWEFEDVMDSLNCTVHAHDPTVNFPPTRGRNQHFHKVGLAAARLT